MIYNPMWPTGLSAPTNPKSRFDSVRFGSTRSDSAGLGSIRLGSVNIKRFEITLFLRIKHSMRVFGVISFVKLQSDT